jgi:hypothetical protein
MRSAEMAAIRMDDCDGVGMRQSFGRAGSDDAGGTVARVR